MHGTNKCRLIFAFVVASILLCNVEARRPRGDRSPPLPQQELIFKDGEKPGGSGSSPLLLENGNARCEVKKENRVPLQVRAQWKILDWEYPSEQFKQDLIKSGDLAAENALPVGVEVWRDKVFVAVPRWKKG
ncbi:hypothetical protein TKK_0000884 [Trichogramma kaykai]